MMMNTGPVEDRMDDLDFNADDEEDKAQQCLARCKHCDFNSPQAGIMRSFGVCDIIWRRKPKAARELVRPRGVGVNEEGRICGEYHPRCKVPDDEVEEMRLLHDVAGIGYKRLARLFKRPAPTVRDIVAYKRRVDTVIEVRRLPRSGRG